MASVVKDGEGSFIPATQRPDGSWRKARRVKDGYVPQEEVPLYESKGKQWANQNPTCPAGVDPEMYKQREIELAKKNNTMYSPIPGLIIDPSNEVKGKKKKKKKKSSSSGNAIEEAAAVYETVVPKVNETNKAKAQKQSQLNQDLVPSASVKGSRKQVVEELDKKVPTNSVAIDPIKRIKNLKKKLREIEALDIRIANGDTKGLDKDQLDKVTRKPDVLSEILALELSLQNK